MGQGWSNTSAATVALPAAEGQEVNRRVEMESPAAAVPEGMAKGKRRRIRKRKQELANAKEKVTVEQEAASVAAAAEGAEVNGKAEMESPAAAVPEGTAKSKKRRNKKMKQEVANAKENGTVEQEAASVASVALAWGETPKCKEDKAKEQGTATTSAVSVIEGTPKFKEEKEERRIEEQEATTSTVSEGTRKHKRKKLKKTNKMQEQQEAAQALSGLVAVDKIVANKPGDGDANGEGASGDADVSMDPINAEDPNCSKAKGANDNDKEKAEERGMVEQGATTSAVSAPEGTAKCKKQLKKKNKMQEQQEPAQALSDLVAVDKIVSDKPGNGGTNGEGASSDADVSMDPINAEDPNCSEAKEANDNDKKAKELRMVEQGTTTFAVSAMEGTPKFNVEKEKEGGIADQKASTGTVSSPEGTTKRKRKKLKKENKMQEQQEPAQASSGLVAVDKIVANKPGDGDTNGEAASGDADVSMDPINAEDPNCSKAKGANDNDKQKAEERGMVEQGTTTSAVSAMEGTPKCKDEKEKVTGIVDQEATTSTVSAPEGTTKRKRKKLKRNNKIQEQEEPAHALSGFVEVGKTVSHKPGNYGTNGEGALSNADVNMDPVNVEDPNCSKAKDANDKVKWKAQEGNKICSEKCILLPEGSEDGKSPKRKRKRDASSIGPDITSQDLSCTCASMDHDLSCTCASCLVQAHKEKIRNIYSPRGSLVRFQRKKLLILDLNGLLADINMDNQNAHMAHAKVKGKLVFRRPYYDDFLRFCFQNFELGIWSSRKKENVYSVVDILMRDLKQHLLFCWDMSKCTFTGRKVIGDKHKPLVLKELKKLWNKEDPNLPWEQGEFSPSNTLLVDDSPYKALCNPPHTAIFPQPYSYLDEDDFSLGPGGDLRVYLERLAAADDVQDFVRDNPFGQPSIMESDPKWNFYSKIVNEVERGLSLKWKF